MAPEILLGANYQPQSVDLFALGVILFMLYSGRAPFQDATLDDPHYCLLARLDTERFWSTHEHDKAPGFFTDDFKNLITSMLAY